MQQALFLSTASALLALVGASPAMASPAENQCPADGNLIAYCGLPNPEDIEVLPGGKGVIVSDMGIRRGPAGIEGHPGTVKWLDPATRKVTALYPAPGVQTGIADWGDLSCPGEIGSVMNAHGIHLSRRGNGSWQVLVVNHGGRESVEFFELTRRGGSWAMRWRGCAVPPGPNRLNDVVALPDGGFLVTSMYRQGADVSKANEQAARGENTGLLWHWSPGKGFREEPGSASPRPNGIQVDSRARFAFINTAANGGEVWKLDLGKGQIVGKAAMSKPDNSSWSGDGRLLVTGITAAASSMPCFADPQAPCASAFDVFAIDPETMRAERIFGHSGPPVGGGTVAVQFGQDMLVGSFAGDRILRVKNQFARPAAKRGSKGNAGR